MKMRTNPVLRFWGHVLAIGFFTAYAVTLWASPPFEGALRWVGMVGGVLLALGHYRGARLARQEQHKSSD